MVENKIVNMIVYGYPWQTILAEIVSQNNMDPWNINISLLCEHFIKYINRIEKLDFRIPAHYVIIASVLLRMKMDTLNFFEEDENVNVVEEEDKIEFDESIFNINFKSRRVPPAKSITFDELVKSLKKVMESIEKKRERIEKMKENIVLKHVYDINERIKNLYNKILFLLTKIKEDRISFSEIVGSWEKDKVLETFIPLLHLDHQKKIKCEQNEAFGEIWIKRRF